MKNMERGKKVNIYSLMEEINDINVKIKNAFIKIFDYIYYDLQWGHSQPPRNRVALYNKVEEILGNNNK